jgi:hypothetical protein
MPNPNRAVKITTKSGKTFTARTPEESDMIIKSIADAGEDVNGLKMEPITPLSNETTWGERAAGALGMGAAGAIAGGIMGGGVPGAVIGGGIGALTGAAFPPKTGGEWAAGIGGSLVGGPVGGKIAQAASKAPPILGGLIRAGGGLAEAELGSMLQTGIDTGNPQGFNPISLGGATAAMLPNVGDAWKGIANSSPGVISSRLKGVIPGLKGQLTNKTLATERMNSPFDALSDYAFNRAKPASETAVTAVKKNLIEPIENQLTLLEKQKNDLTTQMQELFAGNPKGTFATTQRGAQRGIIETELADVTSKLDELTLVKAEATLNALKNKMTAANKKREALGNTGVDKAGISINQSSKKVAQESWKLDYLQDVRTILEDTNMRPGEKASQLRIIQNDYQQKHSTFQIEINQMDVEKKFIDAAEKKYKAMRGPAERNVQSSQKAKGEAALDETKLKIERGKLKGELSDIAKEEKAYYKQAQQVTGVNLQGVKTAISETQTQLKSLSILPPALKKIVGSDGDVDKFVDEVRKMRPDEWNELIQYIPSGKRKEFSEQMGDSIVFDFFIKSFDPQTGQMSRLQKYVNENGIPKVEQFYGIPNAQEKFTQLTERLIKATPQGDGNWMRNQLQTYLTAAAVRGAAYQGLYMLFGTSGYHSGGGLKTAGAGIAALGVATPVLIKKMMDNEKLAENFIRFVDSGGTLTYAQLPYLAKFIEKEARPLTEQEIEDANNFRNELIRANETNEPQEQQSPQGQGVQQPPQPQGQVPQAPQGQPGQMNPSQAGPLGSNSSPPVPPQSPNQQPNR